MKQLKNQKGFTLVEIAIVLVIIGLLLGGVLKGQEMIENAKVKNAANLFNAVSSGINGYLDRYRALPGDDCCVAQKTARGGEWLVAMNGNGQNQAADGLVNDASVAAWGTWNGWQHVTFWLDLYAAGFLTGSTSARNATVFPKSPWGTVDIVGIGSTYGMSTNALVICMNNVPGKAGAQLDTMLDDGNPSTGTVRANTTLNATAPTITAYDEGVLNYILCRRM
jgi:prepilin-type N-terminal cleavage/methylation domain-containing protein